MSKLTLSLVGLLGTGVSGVGIAYALHIRSIESLYSEDLLDENEGEMWKELQLSLNKDDAVNASIMKDIQDKQQTTSVTDGNKLKTWCMEIKKESINTLYPTSRQKTIKSYVSKYCIKTIGDKLTRDKLFTEQDVDDVEVKKRHKELHEHNGNPVLNIELQKIKDSYKENDYKAFKDWCLNIYKRGYKNATHSNWVLADKFCKKS